MILNSFIKFSKEAKKGKQNILSLVSFSFTIMFAIIFEWEAFDLIWGLWASSLSIGFMFGVIVILTDPNTSENAIAEKKFGKLFLMILFFVFHFGLFHFCHGIFLNIVFPIVDNFDQFPYMLTYPVNAFESYWIFVAMSFISRVMDLRSAALPSNDLHRLLIPYKNIVRMHILIFVFAFLSALDLIRYAIYPILIFYFFPLPIVKIYAKKLFEKLEDRMNTAGLEKDEWD